MRGPLQRAFLPVLPGRQTSSCPATDSWRSAMRGKACSHTVSYQEPQYKSNTNTLNQYTGSGAQVNMQESSHDLGDSILVCRFEITRGWTDVSS